MPNITNKEFADAVFHTMPEGAYMWGTCFTTPPDLTSNGEWFGGIIKERSITCKSHYTSGEANTFYTVSSFKSGADERIYRRKANFAAAHVVTLDDIGEGMSAKIPWSQVTLEPSFVIETSPDNCQVGYILVEPVTDADYFNRAVDALVEQGLASPCDPGMKGVTRYVRFPVGLNNKTKYDPPWQHVCRGWRPERLYGLADIISAYDLTLAPPQAQYIGGPAVISAADDAYVGCLHDLGLVLTGRTRSGGEFNMLDILCPWHEEHTDRVDVGTVYIVGGGFNCFHGHCSDRGFRDMKARLHKVYGVDTDALDAANAAARLGLEQEDTQALMARLMIKGDTDVG